MRTLLLSCAVAATAAISFAVPAPAEARQGCGPGAHRTPNGRCVADRRVRRGPVLVVGRFYQGRGYWDGRRYYQQRYRYRNGWRYR